MKNLKTKMMTIIKNTLFLKSAIFTLVLTLNVTTHIFASDAGMDSFDNIIDVIARWLGRIGLVVAFFGAVQLALGFKQDDADGKIRGMKTLASGFLVFGITQSLSLFGL